MRKLINILVYIVVFYVVYVSIANFATDVTLQLGAINELIKFGIPSVSKNFPFGILSLCILVVGIVFGVCFVGQFYFVQKDKLNAYKRELEKSSVSNSTSTSRVEVLEAKIATLEKALDNALNNNNNN